MSQIKRNLKKTLPQQRNKAMLAADHHIFEFLSDKPRSAIQHINLDLRKWTCQKPQPEKVRTPNKQAIYSSLRLLFSYILMLLTILLTT